MLAHRGPGGEETWRDGEAGLACQLSGVSAGPGDGAAALIGQSGAVLVFDGRLDNRDELAAALGLDHRVWAGRSDAELVSIGYDRYRIELPERLLGDFAFAVFDPAVKAYCSREMSSDRSLYYFRTSRTFAFASEIKALLVHPQLTARPNDEMLRAYLLHGRFRPRRNVLRGRRTPSRGTLRGRRRRRRWRAADTGSSRWFTDSGRDADDEYACGLPPQVSSRRATGGLGDSSGRRLGQRA